MRRSLEAGVALILTSRCNLACSYCYEAGCASRGDLPWDAAKAALDAPLAASPASLEIAFTGGEPFLADDLLRRCVAYARETARPGTRLAFSASSNGLLLDEERARFLAANDFDLQVSWDGEAQEQRARGTSAAVTEGIARLAAAEPGWFRRRVRVAYTLTTANLALLPASVETFLRAGLRTVVVSPAWGLEWPPAAELERALDGVLAEVARACAPLVRDGEPAPLRAAVAIVVVLGGLALLGATIRQAMPARSTRDGTSTVSVPVTVRRWVRIRSVVLSIVLRPVKSVCSH